MKGNNILLSVIIFYFCFSCKSQGDKSDQTLEKAIDKGDSNQVRVDSIYIKVSKGKIIDYRKIEGNFVYVDDNNKREESIAHFVTQESNLTLIYTGYPDSRNDKISWNKSTLSIRSKLDPSSVNIYRIVFNLKEYIVITGKAQSASGSGVQVTYFVLSELDKNGKLSITNEFESRFGDINNLLDFNEDGIMDYFKIKNGNKGGEYLLTINSTTNDESITGGHMLLSYKLNDKFMILEDRLSK